MFLDTIQTEWRTLNQASVDQTSVTDYELTSTSPYYPSDASSKTRLEIKANGLRMRFAVSDAADKDAKCNIWGWDTNGVGKVLVNLTILSGTMACSKKPYTGSDLTDFKFVDTITINENNVGALVSGASGGNSLQEIRFDLRGISYILADFDCDAGAAESTDAICFYKGY